MVCRLSTRAYVRTSSNHNWWGKLALVFIILPTVLLAESDDFDEDWRWVHFTTRSGLPSDHVYSLVETKNGTIWIATAAGLAWYDGYQWIPSQTIELPQGGPMFLYTYDNDKILFSYRNKIYFGDRNGFQSQTFPGIVNAVPFAEETFLIMYNASLYILKKGELIPFEPSSEVTHENTFSLWKTRGGNIWISVIGGLYRLDDDDWRLMLPTRNERCIVSSLIEDEKGTGLVYVFYPFDKRGLWEWYENGKPTLNENETGYNLKTMEYGPNGDVLAVYVSGEIRIRQNGTWHSLPTLQSKLRDLESFRFRPNGDLWVGTQHGLYLYRQSSSRWTVIKHEAPDKRNWIHEILHTSNGDLWLATADGIEMQRVDGSTEYITHVLNRPLYTITGLAEDREGDIWVSSGSAFDGAFRWDGSRWKYFEIMKNPDGVRVHKIRKDRQGRLWFLGLSKGFGTVPFQEPGTFVFEHGRFTRWGVEEGLIHGRVYSFAQEKDGALWFGTFGGLSRWNDGKWRHWTQSNGLRSTKIYTIAIDDAQRIWFGHSNDASGLGMLEGDSIQYYTKADGLVNDKVWDLNVDSTGVLWISTEGGLCSYNNGIWSTFDEKTGLNYNRLWPVLPMKHEVYVGTLGSGLAILNREESKVLNPRIVMRDPVTSERGVILRWDAFTYWAELEPQDILTRYRTSNGLWSAWSTAREITYSDLSPGEYTSQVQAKDLFGNFNPVGKLISFSIAPPLFLQPMVFIPTALLTLGVIVLGVSLIVRKRKHDIALKKSEARFRAVAEMTLSAIFIYQDSKLLFVNPGAEQLTEYSQEELLKMNLWDIVHPEYRESIRAMDLRRTGETAVPHRDEFKIITKKGDERWVNFSWGWIRYQDTPATLAIAFDITERKLAEEKLRLLASELSSTEERERRRLATYLHDTIGQVLAFCKMKIRLLQRVGLNDDLDTRLQEIRELIEQSIADTRSLTYELSPPILYELSFDAAMEWLTNHISQKHHLAIVLEDDKEPKSLDDELRVFLFHAIRELLINVVKHAEARNVKVCIGMQDSRIKIQIVDDGIGFDTSVIGTAMNASSGFGLFNIRERLKYFGGTFDIQSSAGKGTQICLIAPMKGKLQ
ncbi:MAG: PAS domain S-box protein [Ignavibacteriae bacterium]|nr:PAS domain S-box protein [Ignavibacteriota bacterium]